jgi:hypothetical protein
MPTARISPEMEAKLIAQGATVRHANPAAFGGAMVDLSSPAEGCSEDEFRAKIIKLAKLCGYEHYHTHDSRRSAEGFPDDHFGRLWGEQRLVVFEAKVPPRKPTEKQRLWIRIYEGLGPQAVAMVVYPDQWPLIVEILKRP